jgi:hypothetical protein
LFSLNTRQLPRDWFNADNLRLSIPTRGRLQIERDIQKAPLDTSAVPGVPADAAGQDGQPERGRLNRAGRGRWPLMERHVDAKPERDERPAGDRAVAGSTAFDIVAVDSNHAAEQALPFMSAQLGMVQNERAVKHFNRATLTTHQRKTFPHAPDVQRTTSPPSDYRY